MAAKKKKDESPAENTAAEAEEVPVNEGAAETPAESAAGLSEEKDKYLRLMAEYDNFRKRSAKERENIYTDVRVNTVQAFLPVYDNLERALAASTADEAFRKGVEMTFTQLKEVFTKLGVEEIKALGEKFDPVYHNEVMHIDDEALEENVIVEEFQKGFKLGEKVIRFSMVKVAN